MDFGILSSDLIHKYYDSVRADLRYMGGSNLSLSTLSLIRDRNYSNPGIILRDRGFYTGYLKKYLVSSDIYGSLKDHDSFGYVVPIIEYDLIKDYSKINGETITFGKGIKKSIEYDKKFIKRIKKENKIYKTGKYLTILLFNDGRRKQVPIYKDIKENREFVIVNNKTEDDKIGDYPFEYRIFEVAPLTWKLNKKTGIAICKSFLFVSEMFEGDYEQSYLSSFLQSDEFLEELEVDKRIKKNIENQKFKDMFSSNLDLKPEKSIDIDNTKDMNNSSKYDESSSDISNNKSDKSSSISSPKDFSISNSDTSFSKVRNDDFGTSNSNSELNSYQKQISNIVSEKNIKNYGLDSKNLNLEQKIRRIIMGENRIPYLVGHPGVGKTQVAKSINRNFLSMNMATMDPDEFKGKPYIIQGEKNIIPDGNGYKILTENSGTSIAEPTWHSDLIKMSNKCYKNNERCVLFLDEFDKLVPQMQVFINGVVDNPRTIGHWVIPDNVDIILAGNTEEYSDASFNISGEVESRLTRLVVEVSVNDWLRWASKNKIDPVVRAYINNYPSKLIEDVKDKDGKYDYNLSLTPRSWDQKISQELRISRYNKISPYLVPYMDEKNYKSLISFKDFYDNIGIEDILKGDFPSDISFLTPDQLQVIINCLIPLSTTEEELINAMKFIKETNLNEYQSFFEKVWTDIYNTNEDINKIKMAKLELNGKTLVKKI